MLLQSEEIRAGELELDVQTAVAECWKQGRFYYEGEKYEANEHGSFATAVTRTTTTILPTMFPHFDPITISPAELTQLLEKDLNGPSVKFMVDKLGILEVDSGRYVAACSGVVPRRIREHIKNEDGVGGAGLLQYFGRPPYGYRPEVVKACVIGLLRGSKIKIQSPDAGGEITAVRDAGATDLFTKDRDFKRADYFPIKGDDGIGYRERARICRFFANHLGLTIHTEDALIADAISNEFPKQAIRLRTVQANLDALPGRRESPAELAKLQTALESCLMQPRSRQTRARFPPCSCAHGSLYACKFRQFPCLLGMTGPCRLAPCLCAHGSHHPIIFD